MQLAYIIISFFQSMYFLFKKRKVDFHTIAFFSSLIYFIPGFLGFVRYPGGIKVDLDEKVYIVFLLVQSSIWLTAMACDYLSYNQKDTAVLKYSHVEGTGYISRVLISIALVLTAYIIINLNDALLESKNILLPLLGRDYLILRYSAGAALVLSYIERRRVVFILSLTVLVFTFIIGSRSPLALAVIAVIALAFNKNPKSILFVKHFKKLFLILIFGYLIFMGKIFYGSFKREGFLAALRNIFDKEHIIQGFSGMEPLGIQSILNEIMVTDFTTGFTSLKNIFYEVTILPTFYNAETKSFNDMFQPNLFPNANHGMAYNIWGEAISIGGFPFLILVIILFNVGIIMFNKIINSNNNILKAFGAYAGIYWCFYIHRNSLATEFIYIRNIIVVLIIGLVLSVVLTIILKPKTKYYRHTN
ncbi:hypothetical protein [Salibacterium sp. K-3]